MEDRKFEYTNEKLPLQFLLPLRGLNLLYFKRESIIILDLLMLTD